MAGRASSRSVAFAVALCSPGGNTSLPKLKLFVLLAILAALTVVGSITAAPSSRAQSHADADLQALIVQDVNAVRQSRGVPPLRTSAALEAAAREHTDEMALHGYFSHNSLDGGSFAARIKAYYRRGHERVSGGENLFWATGDPRAELVIAAWAGSAPHRANLLNPNWREIGVSAIHMSAAPGVFEGEDVVIITTDFGTTRS
jgi:uncharacterized protein YkwD